MDLDWERSQLAFTAAAAWFVRTSAQVQGRWTDPGLGEWDLRALVGHTSRALLTVETYLDRSADVVELDSTAAYYRAARDIAAGPDVTARGREAGEALGEHPAAEVAAIAERIVARVAGCTGGELVSTVVGGMRLRDYLPTRTFELVVHTTDVCQALGLPMDVPAAPAREAMAIVADLASVEGSLGRLLLAVTGRRGLPAGFSVL